MDFLLSYIQTHKSLIGKNVRAGAIGLLMGIGLCLSPLSAQEKIQLKYKAGEAPIEGSVKVNAFLDLGEDTQAPKRIQKNQSITIDEAGKAKIVLIFEDLEWTSPAGFDGKMMVNTGDIFSTNSTVLGDQNKPVRIGIGRRREAALPILGPGTTIIKITIRINADGIDNKIISAVDFPLTIRVKKEGSSTEPSSRELELAWQNAKKENSVTSYQAYLGKYPDGPMVKLARQRIEMLKSMAESAPEKTPEQSSEAPKQPQADQAENAFNRAKTANSVAALERFLTQYPDSKFASEAEDILAEIRDIEISEVFAEGTQFEYSITHAKAPVSFTVTPEDGLSYDWDEENQLFSASISDNQRHTVKVTDGRDQTVYFELDASVSPITLSEVEFDNDENGMTQGLSFNIEGGSPPYILVLQPGEGDEMQLQNIESLRSAGAVVLSSGDIEDALGSKLEEGSYQILVRDQRKSKASEKIIDPFATWNVVQPSPRESEFPLIPVLGGVLALVIVLAVVFTRKKKAPVPAPKSSASETSQQRQTNTRSVATVGENASPTPPSTPPVEKPRTAEVNKPVAPKGDRPRTTIRVSTRKTGQNISKRPFVADSAPIGTYFAFDLTEHWPESAVHTIYLHKDSIAALDKFIQEENVSKIQETPDSIPEIGGFLLGNFKATDNPNQYLVALEKFVPVTPGEQGVYKIEFGEAAWAELDNIMTDNPDLHNIGWFHTHPGHSLFLSQPDIRIHSGFYREKYQVAMEVDTLTPGLDTAFFTRRPDGEINNSKDRMPGTDWFQWQWVIDWMRAQNV